MRLADESSTTTLAATDGVMVVQNGNVEIISKADFDATLPAGDVPYDDTAVLAAIEELETNKQDTLVSGTNLKTINGTSLLGAGNVTISGSGGASTFTGLADTPSAYTGAAGKAVHVNGAGTGLEFLTTESNTSVSIEAYGAVSDEVSPGFDSTTAIQAALNTGKTVYVPKGTYNTNPVYMQPGQRLFGAGKYKSTLKLKAQNINNVAYFGGVVNQIGTSSAPVLGGVIEYLCIDGNKANITTSGSTNTFNIEGIHWEYAHYPTVKECRIMNARAEGVDIDQTYGARVFYCEVLNNGGSGIHNSVGTEASVIVGNHVEGNGTLNNRNGIDSFDTGSVGNHTVVGNIVRNNNRNFSFHQNVPQYSYLAGNVVGAETAASILTKTYGAKIATARAQEDWSLPTLKLLDDELTKVKPAVAVTFDAKPYYDANKIMLLGGTGGATFNSNVVLDNLTGAAINRFYTTIYYVVTGNGTNTVTFTGGWKNKNGGVFNPAAGVVNFIEMQYINSTHKFYSIWQPS
jgi:hypothetical protein